MEIEETSAPVSPTRFRKVYAQYKEERAQLENKFAKLYGAIYAQRALIVSGRGESAENGGETILEQHGCLACSEESIKLEHGRMRFHIDAMSLDKRTFDVGSNGNFHGGKIPRPGRLYL